AGALRPSELGGVVVRAALHGLVSAEHDVVACHGAPHQESVWSVTRAERRTWDRRRNATGGSRVRAGCGLRPERTGQGPTGCSAVGRLSPATQPRATQPRATQPRAASRA